MIYPAWSDTAKLLHAIVGVALCHIRMSQAKRFAWPGKAPKNRLAAAGLVLGYIAIALHGVICVARRVGVCPPAAGSG